MGKNLWRECINCKTKCCCWDIAFPLFVTPDERKRHEDINTKNPCIYLNDCGLCDIHNDRPYDCRFFPFDLMKINERLFWIIWDVDCQIIKNKRDDFERYITEHEEKLIPSFIEYVEDYAEFRVEELKRKYKFEVLREAIIQKKDG